MPFTLSHVAAILPVRRWLPPSALAVGAMVPDLPYYLPLPFSSASTHAWWGPPLLGVPAGAVLLVLFHVVVRAPLAALAPAGLRARLPDAARPAPAAVVAALLAGMATHLIWDGFTQIGGFAVAHWQPLRLSVIGPHRVFNVLMYISSAGGLAALAGWFALWYRRAPVRPGRLPGVARRVSGGVLAAAAAAAFAGAAAGAMTDRAAVSDYDLVRSVILGGADGAAAAFACYVLAWHVWNVMSTRRAASDAGPPV
ncbi:DUF4184 family protein [Planotetraspora phitsanulokensis]|uniref:DUF4184 family protein n=1 Tax=Planotetraspora phitsanulokensis TaxID=575192 RepID=A0A8J3U0W2_9ACTN|nr:DUF4184 family protein [Planotetraspora phitsanulokensis]GII35852.1 hypothetical protein Pph01_08550 [Planotetraspora phitsanulokensis]